MITLFFSVQAYFLSKSEAIFLQSFWNILEKQNAFPKKEPAFFNMPALLIEFFTCQGMSDTAQKY